MSFCQQTRENFGFHACNSEQLDKSNFLGRFFSFFSTVKDNGIRLFNCRYSP